MNERMLDLIEESRDLVPTQTKVGGGMYIPGPIVRGDVNLQRFAELIVRECVSVGRTAFLNDNSTVPIFPAKQIQEHFGVAE
jgi:hypothetical protein